jgi:REP element-mobilizing transposase RayT
MLIAHHLIWTAYGWWLPNDPRGSTSLEIRVERIGELGPSHLGRKPVQPPGGEIAAFYREAAGLLAHPLLTLDDGDVRLVGESFAAVIRRRNYTCYACAIMPNHVHLIVRRHRDSAEQMIAEFQRASAVALVGEGRRPADHPVWGGPGWKVFLNARRDVTRTIEYVRLNPVKIGCPVQTLEFVQPYDGWLPGAHPEAPRAAKPQADKRSLI